MNTKLDIGIFLSLYEFSCFLTRDSSFNTKLIGSKQPANSNTMDTKDTKNIRATQRCVTAQLATSAGPASPAVSCTNWRPSTYNARRRAFYFHRCYFLLFIIIYNQW